MEKSLAYKDVYLVPQYSELKSRSLADVSVVLGGRVFKNPVMPANMVSCINDEKAKWLSENGYFYVRHRFNLDSRGRSDNFEFCLKAQKENWKTISISVGVKKWDYIDIENLSGSFGHIGYEGPTRVDYITIDIAHGHSLAMKNMLSHIKSMFRSEEKKPFIIAGNVTTIDAVNDLHRWGADAIKVGIGGGGACSTKNKTGFHVPMFSAIKECRSSHFLPIIADGGIRENGDITKALVAGADMVMAGSLFSACIDSPAENVYEPTYIKNNFGNGPIEVRTDIPNGKVTHKRYFGSASARNKGENKHVEGFEIDLPCNGMTYAQKMQEITEDLQSAVSYAGRDSLRLMRYTPYVTV